MEREQKGERVRRGREKERRNGEREVKEESKGSWALREGDRGQKTHESEEKS